MKTQRKILHFSLMVAASLLVPLTARAQEDVIPLHNAPTGPTRGSGSISGKVVLPSGQPVNERVRIILSTMTNPGMVLYTDSAGGFGFAGLAEGLYTIEATGDSKLYETVTQEVRLIRGMHVRLNINLKEKASASGGKSLGHVVSLAELDQKVPSAAKKEFETATRLVNEGKILEGIERFKAAIAISPNYLMARNDLGVQYLKLKRVAEATQQFEAAIDINPKSFNPRLNIGIALVEQRRFAEAIDHLTLAISISSSSPSAHLYLGIAALETDDLATALREIDLSQSIGGQGYSVAHYFRARVALKNGERAQAISQLDEYLKNAPDGEYATKAKALLEELKHN